MKSSLPPIVKQAEGLMRDIEIAVSHFPRRHRYTVGARLSEMIMEVAFNAHQAWRVPHVATLEALAASIDRLKLQLQLGQQIHAFASFGQFELLARAAVSLGKQCGGWQKRWNLKRQNEQRSAAAQSPQMLLVSVEFSYAQQYLIQADSWNDASRWLQGSYRSNVPVLAANEGSLLKSERSDVPTLRRSWHQSLRTLANLVRQLSRGHGSEDSRATDRAGRQQRQLRAVELSLGHKEAELTKSAHLAHGDRRWHYSFSQRVGRDNGAWSRHGKRPAETWMDPRAGGKDAMRRSKVDDFVLVHESRAQLMAWRDQIARFLGVRLRLTLKPEQRLEQLSSGIDFLGYVIFPRHTLVRRRVVAHAREKISAWRRHHVRGRRIIATAEQLAEIRSICASYAGHFKHANTWRLRSKLRAQNPWLRQALRSNRGSAHDR